MAVKVYEKDPEAVLDYSIQWGAQQWAAATFYRKYDWVWNPLDGKWYSCNYPHTSQAALEDDVAKWDEEEDRWLEAPIDEQISAVVWTVEAISGDAAPLTVDSDVDDGYFATAWMSGGWVGKSYLVECKITSNNVEPRTDERKFKVKIVER